MYSLDVLLFLFGSTLSPAKVPPSPATRRLSSMARARRARGSGEGGGGPGHGNAWLGLGLTSRLEKSSTRRLKELAERRASLRCKAGSEASCGTGIDRSKESLSNIILGETRPVSEETVKILPLVVEGIRRRVTVPGKDEVLCQCLGQTDSKLDFEVSVFIPGKDRASCQSGGAPALRPGAVAQSPGREAAMARASLAQRSPASSVLLTLLSHVRLSATP